MKQLAILTACIVTCSMDLAYADTRCQVFPPGGYVGAYADSLGQDSTIVLEAHPGFWLGRIHVLAVLNGAVAEGITGAQFRVHLPLAPTGMFITPAVPPPDASVYLGSPLAIGAADGGLTVGFAHCAQGYPGAGGKVIVPLARVDILTSESFDTPVYVQELAPPDFRAPCPIFSRCDGAFTPAPMELRGVDSAGEAFAFSGRLLCSGGEVATEPRSWTIVKTLYR